MIDKRLCDLCKNRLDGFPANCKAYPLGIPKGILSGIYDHRIAQPGDQNVQFEAIDGVTDSEVQSAAIAVIEGAELELDIEPEEFSLDR
jgi:hypothetical protein